jgi:hypothetical protein
VTTFVLAERDQAMPCRADNCAIPGKTRMKMSVLNFELLCGEGCQGDSDWRYSQEGLSGGSQVCVSPCTLGLDGFFPLYLLNSRGVSHACFVQLLDVNMHSLL